MKKQFISLLSMMSFSFAFAQVGINTETPKATLDVTGKPSDVTKTDGFIAPRLTGAELKAKDANYDTPQTGAIVYVTQGLLPTATTTKTVNITTTGYYYFDGTVWQNLKGGATNTEPWNVAGTTDPATSNTQNIYQTGKIAIGVNPGLTPSATITVNENYTLNDTGGSSYGINNQLTTTRQGSKSGIYNSVNDSSTAGGGVTQGMGNFVTSSNPSVIAIQGISNSLIIGNNASPSANVSVISSSVLDSRNTVNNTLISNTLSTRITGAKASNSGTGMNSALNAYINPAASSTYNASQYFGQYNYLELNPEAGANLNLVLAAASNANFTYIIPRGAYTSTGVHGSSGAFERLRVQPAATGSATISTSFGLRSFTEHISTGSITVNNIKTIESRTRISKDTGNFNVTGNIYGIDIMKDTSSSGTANITGNIYGLHIDPFGFNGHPANKTYNIYSEGVNTKNVFDGRVAIGNASPSAPLHVVKKATDLSPAIIEGCNEYPDNTAAVAAGLSIGALYRSGDVLKVVH
ncbi:hypothetical protein HHL23_22325 [Chryseobacterium sp. RP-3-3]|uniref:Uncharacterized protein n=1 Tax=Chryseobacterium antibioticum TaxID=2728847 RepID=A0A7Y0AS38_9FLAO|nr:hypothetical protein [Chryseobacterium antibioticum]NML72490.1 hypothetical protein [Chryseobacterium antibioticum]